MKYLTPKWLIISFFSMLALNLGQSKAATSESNANESSLILTRKNLQQKSKIAIEYLRFNLGRQRFDSFYLSLKMGYANYLPAEACKATFMKIGELDFGLVLIDKEFASGIYAVVHENDIISIMRFNIPAGATEANTKVPAILCESWTELALTRATYNRLSTSSASYSNLRTVTNLDSFCVAPMESAMEFTCFSYSSKDRSFVDVGGWFND